MYLKRHFKTPEGWEPIRNVKGENGKLLDPKQREGECLNLPPLDYIEVKHTGISAAQNFSERLINQGIASGFISISKGVLILHAKPEDLKYDILRTPGYYCCHCGERIVDAGLPSAPGSLVTIGSKHVHDAHGDGVLSPDAGNPSGYARLMHFECALAADQHKKFRSGGKRHG